MSAGRGETGGDGHDLRAKRKLVTCTRGAPAPTSKAAGLGERVCTHVGLVYKTGKHIRVHHTNVLVYACIFFVNTCTHVFVLRTHTLLDLMLYIFVIRLDLPQFVSLTNSDRLKM